MPKNKATSLQKAPTGISGVDQITDGGLPRGRPTLVCGGAGCGKTLFSVEFLVRGATEFNEPGLFVAFEETEQDLIQNFVSLGFDLNKLIRQKKLVVEYIHIQKSEIEETGEYDLEGLFIRLGAAIDEIGAKRVVLDTIEVLFGGLSNTAILRTELRRLFTWLKSKGVTVVVTGERGEGTLTRFGIEEYVSDCVISLDHRVKDQLSIRRLRILKYRGSKHGTNEYPFLIDDAGISLLPITSIGLTHKVSNQRISTGIPGLDMMMGGKGFFRGSSVLVTGTPGTGKSSLAAHFVNSVCARGERALYFSFEESTEQILRNMKSIGLDLRPWINRGLLRFEADRSTFYGLETHLVMMLRAISEFKPHVVVIDPITVFLQTGSQLEVRSMLVRLIDFMKSEGITAFCTSLTSTATAEEQTDTGLSSLMDTWVLLRSHSTGGMRDHGMYILKSRGMAHSNGVRQFRFTDTGIILQ